MYQLSILRELGERIGYSLKIDKIVEIIAGSLRRVIDYSTVSYMLVSPQPDGKDRVVFNISLEQPVSKPFIDEIRTKMLSSLNAIMGKTYTQDSLEESVSGTITDPTSAGKVGSFFNVPVVIGGRPVGILNIASIEPKHYQQQEVDILYTIVNQASDAVTKLEHVLDTEKGKLNAMVASMADGVLMIDNQKQLVVINLAAKEMLGVEKEKVTIFDILDVVAGEFDLRTKLEESLKQNEVVLVEPITINGRFLEVLISPVKDRDKSFLGAVVLFHDVTREKEVEKMREDFTNMMVHELRSPLTGIKSIAGLLAGDKVKNDANKYSEFVRLISTNAEDMLGLVNDLLDVAKIESGKFQLLKKAGNLRQLISDRAESFRPLAEQHNLTLKTHIDASTPDNIELDEHKIVQVLNNFTSNAIKFTGAGGTITISSFLLPKDNKLARTVVEQKLIWPGVQKGVTLPVDSVVVAVTDTGGGISKDSMSKLFNKFVQLENAAKSEKKGTGLGLVISKGIVEAHDGTIGVFSEEGEGSTFYFTLPLVEAGSTPKKSDGFSAKTKPQSK
jgi:PAS domain S-box-containing protein